MFAPFWKTENHYARRSSLPKPQPHGYQAREKLIPALNLLRCRRGQAVVWVAATYTRRSISATHPTNIRGLRTRGFNHGTTSAAPNVSAHLEFSFELEAEWSLLRDLNRSGTHNSAILLIPKPRMSRHPAGSFNTERSPTTRRGSREKQVPMQARFSGGAQPR